MCKTPYNTARINSQPSTIRAGATPAGAAATCTGGYKGPKTPVNG